MFTHFIIENFRSFSHLSLSDLENFNLITGMNGSGKSSVLEAILLNCQLDFNSVLTINNARGESLRQYLNDRPLRSLFNDFAGATPALIAATWKTGAGKESSSTRTLRLRPIWSDWKYTRVERDKPIMSGVELQFHVPGQAGKSAGNWAEELLNQQNIITNNGRSLQQPQAAAYRVDIRQANQLPTIRSSYVVPPSRNAHEFIYQNLVAATREKNIPAIVKIASIIDSRVQNFVPLVESGSNEIYVDIGLKRLIPLTMMGAGFGNMLQLAVSIVQTNSRVVLVDEIEDGLHYTTFPKFSESLIDLVEQTGIQFVVSTHSGEFLDAFTEAAKRKNFQSVAAFRVADRLDGTKVVTRFEANELESAKKIDLDVR